MNPPAISIFEYSTIEIHCILCHKSKRWKEVLLHYENFSSSVISKNLKCCMTFHILIHKNQPNILKPYK